MTLAPRAIPDQPYFPNCPALGGMNGVQFAQTWLLCLSANDPAIPMNMSTIETFTITIPELKFADSLMPITRIVVTAIMAQNATRLNRPFICGRGCQSMP